MLKESELKKSDLSVVMENSAALQALVEGSEAQLEDQLFELNEDWERVHTLIEDWLSAVLVSDCLNLHHAVNSFRFTSSQQLLHSVLCDLSRLIRRIAAHDTHTCAYTRTHKHARTHTDTHTHF